MIAKFLAVPIFLSASLANAADQTEFTIATVRTGLATQFWGDLVKEFEGASHCKINYTKEQKNLYEVAKDPSKNVDMVITHTRHEGLWDFVKTDYGQAPLFIMSNSTVFLAPSGDPAGIGNITDHDPFAMMEAIAKAPGACFVVNGDTNTKYISLTLSANIRGAWYIDNGLQQDKAADYASEKGCYTLWGNTAFNSYKNDHPGSPLGIISANGNIMRRQMVAVIVNPAKFEDGARRAAPQQCAKDFVEFLLAPETQKKILGDGFEGSGRNNSDDVLCKFEPSGCKSAPDDE
jgi:ABC-type tungstate transport system permease subunit